MPGNDRSRPGKGGSENQAATKQLDATILSRAADIPAYVVLPTTRYGMPRRRVYLDLGHARTAVARARGKGLDAWLILCELTPVQADFDGGDQQ
jgi:hypothetical protein